MKSAGILIFLSMVCFFAMAQKGKYVFHYELKPLFEGEKSSFFKIASEKSGKTALRLDILDYNGDSLVFVPVKISNSDSVIKLISSFANPLTVEIGSGEFTVEIAYAERKPLMFKLVIAAGETVHYSVKLGREKSLDVYEVHSKKKLNKVKLKEILKCIEDQAKFENCSVKDEYYISMQI